MFCIVMMIYTPYGWGASGYNAFAKDTGITTCMIFEHPDRQNQWRFEFFDKRGKRI